MRYAPEHNEATRERILAAPGLPAGNTTLFTRVHSRSRPVTVPVRQPLKANSPAHTDPRRLRERDLRRAHVRIRNTKALRVEDAEGQAVGVPANPSVTPGRGSRSPRRRSASGRGATACSTTWRATA